MRLRRDDLPEELTWPRLSCSGANQLALEFGELRFRNQRDGNTTHNWQISSFDAKHKLVFNRQQGSLYLHEQGDIRFFTGGPTPSERLRIIADGNVSIGTPEEHTVGTLQV